MAFVEHEDGRKLSVESVVGVVLIAIPEPATTATGVALLAHGAANALSGSVSLGVFVNTGGQTQLATSAAGMTAQGVTAGAAALAGAEPGLRRQLGVGAGAITDVVDTYLLARLPITSALEAALAFGVGLPNQIADAVLLADAIGAAAQNANESDQPRKGE